MFALDIFAKLASEHKSKETGISLRKPCNYHPNLLHLTSLYFSIQNYLPDNCRAAVLYFGGDYGNGRHSDKYFLATRALTRHRNSPVRIIEVGYFRFRLPVINIGSLKLSLFSQMGEIEAHAWIPSKFMRREKSDGSNDLN